MENLPDLNFQFIESLTELASVSGVTVKNYFSCVNDVLTTDNFIEILQDFGGFISKINNYWINALLELSLRDKTDYYLLSAGK